MAVNLGESFEEVLRAAQAGSEWAFEVLYREFNPRLLRYFASRLASEADDLAAETWMGAARQMASFAGGEDEFRRWLFTIAHHRLVQQFRSAARRRDDPVPAEVLALHADRPVLDPADHVVGSDSAQAAAAQIAAVLSPDQAEVVLLRILAGLSVEEVAAVMGKRPGAVRVLQHRAIRKLANESFFIEVTP